MNMGRSDQAAGLPAQIVPPVGAISLAVAVVLGDAGVVTLGLPQILRQFGTSIWAVAWVLIAFNLALALAAVPAARVCARRDPAVVSAGGIAGFILATAACALAPSLGVLIAARAAQAAGGALVIVGSLELLVAITGDERSGVRRWALAGVAGAALGPVLGGLLTSAFSWRAIFVAQIPAMLLALPPVLARRDPVTSGRTPAVPGSRDRPQTLANAALGLLSAALSAALFLLVLLLVDGWSRSPAEAAVAVTAMPVAALAARPLLRGLRAGTRQEAVAGSILIAGGLAGFALLPHAAIVWTLAPQVLVGLGLGLGIDSLTAAALRDRVPRAVHGGWTIAARHAGVVVGLAILTPIFTADLNGAQPRAERAIATLVLDAGLPASTKLTLAQQLSRRLSGERGRVPDLRPAFNGLRVPPAQVPALSTLERGLEGQLTRAATRAFRTSFLAAAGLALLALVPALALRGRRRS